MPIVLLLTLCQAESALRTDAERWGDYRESHVKDLIAREAWESVRQIVLDLQRRGLGADISFGLGQCTYGTAKGLGLGDGTASIDNLLSVRRSLFDVPVALSAAARYLAWCLSVAGGDWIGGLKVYNGGPGALNNPDWDARWAANIASYQRALAWAESVLAGG